MCAGSERNVEFANVDFDARTIMVTSALAGRERRRRRPISQLHSRAPVDRRCAISMPGAIHL